MSLSQKVAALCLSTAWRWQPLKRWFLRCTTGLSWSAPWAASCPGPPTGSGCGPWTTAGYVRCPSPSACCQCCSSAGPGGRGQRKNHVINARKECGRRSCSFRPKSLLKGDFGYWYGLARISCSQMSKIPAKSHSCLQGGFSSSSFCWISFFFVLNLKCVKTRTAVSPRWCVLRETHTPGDHFCFNSKKTCVLYRFDEIFLLHYFLGRSAFRNTSEILSDVHGDPQKYLFLFHWGLGWLCLPLCHFSGV